MKTRDQIRNWLIIQPWFWRFHRNFYNHRGITDYTIEDHIYNFKIKRSDLFIKAFPFVGQPEGLKFWSECSVQYSEFLNS